MNKPKTDKHEYDVVVNFLNKPDYQTVVVALNEWQALVIAVGETDYPVNTVYSTNSKVVKLGLVKSVN